MCGIAGFWGKGDLEIAQKMAQAIRYRGPDHQGAWQAEDLFLSFTRLSIIDLDPRSHQPFTSPDERYALVFNGEIYNFQALRSQLEKLGYTFRTRSDTEVLLYALVAWGLEALARLRGMFAFAFYDRTKKYLLLARDPMGKKPLYYFQKPGFFAFASEPKALWSHPEIPKQLSLPALAAYLMLDYVPTPLCISEGIYKLEGGHYLEVVEKAVRPPQPYWEPQLKPPTIPPFEEAVSHLDRLLSEAIKIRLVADVPLGVFLSGGIDSSIVTYYAQQHSTRPIETFSIAFSEKSYDESRYARLVSQHLGTLHHEALLPAQKVLELLDEVLPLLDEPFADPSILPTYYLSHITRQKVIVALGGDGGDELFAGYPTFIADWYQWLGVWLSPSFALRLRGLAATLLRPRDTNISLDFKIWQFLQGYTGPPVERHTRWLATFLPTDLKALLKPEIYSALRPHLEASPLFVLRPYLDRLEGLDRFSQIVYLYYKTYLQDDILFKVDRASMYNSLEVRAPFLDREVVDFVTSLPRAYKQKGRETKYILKKLFRRRLPDEVLFRPKKGFGLPLSQWLRAELRLLVEAILLMPDPWFDHVHLQRLWMSHQQRRANHRKRLWNLYVFKYFAKRWGFLPT